MPTPQSEYLTSSTPVKMSGRIKDITGQRFGRLVVLGRFGFASDGSVTWTCTCDCGKTKVVPGGNLRRQTTTSCGCYKKDCRLNDLTGKHFGKLTVVSRAGSNMRGETTWLCACSCGRTKAVVGYSLTMGMTNSCGSHPKGRSVRDLQGQRFGRLTVVSRAGSNSRKTALWSCLCDCGNTVIVSSGALTMGHTVSCKCFSADRFRSMVTRHGQARRSGYSGAYRS